MKTLTFEEFNKFCHVYRIPIFGNKIKEFFRELDTYKNGEINYDEFISVFIGEMSERWKRLIIILFETLDNNKIGFVDLYEIRNIINPTKHPDDISEKTTGEEILVDSWIIYNKMNLDEIFGFF